MHTDNCVWNITLQLISNINTDEYTHQQQDGFPQWPTKLINYKFYT